MYRGSQPTIQGASDYLKSLPMVNWSLPDNFHRIVNKKELQLCKNAYMSLFFAF